MYNPIPAAVMAVAFLCQLSASDVSGSVVVRHKLTKRKITPATDRYNRGIAVPLDSAGNSAEDVLSFERNHVVCILKMSRLHQIAKAFSVAACHAIPRLDAGPRLTPDGSTS